MDDLEMYFFPVRVFFHKHWRFTGQERKGGNHHYSSLALPPAHGHSDIYLQLCTWDDYHYFFIRIAFNYQNATRWDLPPYWITIWLTDGVFFRLSTWWFISRFLLQRLDRMKPVDVNSHRLSPLYYKRTD